MAAPATIKVTELDFDGIKQNFKVFLSSKDEFKDFDYEASGMSFLMDILAYNTHYNAVMANFVANEMFLDTAAKRSSVLSHAKSLGYMTRGMRSSRAKVDITINTLSLNSGALAPDTFILPKGTAFIASVGNSQFQFVTTNNLSAPKNGNGSYTFSAVELVEGILFSYEYVVSDAAVGVLYKLPNQNADTTTVRLTLRQSISDVTPIEWQNTSTIFNIDEFSKIFFTQEGKDGYYEFYFGNGKMGVLPQLGNLIVAEYISSQGGASNGARKFVPLGKIAHENNPNIAAASYRISLVSSSVGGSDPESIPEIKQNASNQFIVQDRAVTVNDYKALIQMHFANTKSIKVWGGEDNIPARYGKVMVCIQPQFGDFITQDEKDYINGILGSKSVVTVGIEYVDPEYINIYASIIAYYDPTVLPKAMDLPTEVRTVVQNFSSLQLEKFGNHFRYSKFSALIDDIHEAINSNTVAVSAYKAVIPIIGEKRAYTVNFYNQIADGVDTVTSSLFKIYGEEQWVRLSNVGSNLYAVYINDLGKTIQVAYVGSIDLVKGVVSINSVQFLDVNGPELKISTQLVYDDISSGLNNILRIRPEDIIVKAVAELPGMARNLI